MPPNMADWLGPDHLVWFVLDVVEQLDTTAFHATRRRGGVGRQGYDPDMLLGLLVYAYAVGERSSRRIEKLCTDHVAFRIACGDDAPDHTTIARFRAVHNAAFVDLFAQVLRLCVNAGMGKVGSIAIDGTKIAANAARGANRSHDSIREQVQEIAAQVVGEATVTDVAEDHAATQRGGRDDDQLPPGFADHSRRAANIAKALAEVQAQDARDHATSKVEQADLEEHLTGIANGLVTPGPLRSGVDPVAFHRARIARYERQVADLDGLRGVSRERGQARRGMKKAQAALAVALAAQADGQAPDTRTASVRRRDRRRAKSLARGGTGSVVNTTDPDSRLMTEGSGGGSVQGYNAQVAVTDDHLICGLHVSQDANDTGCYTPTLIAATTHLDTLGKTIKLVLADAGYFTRDNLTAPGPERLIAPGKNRDIYATNTPPPATGQPPMIGPPDPAEDMRQRLRDPVNKTRYKRRSATVEPVIAHLKDHLGLHRFSRRGIAAVTAELNLTAAVVNLNRLHKAGLSTS